MLLEAVHASNVTEQDWQELNTALHDLDTRSATWAALHGRITAASAQRWLRCLILFPKSPSPELAEACRFASAICYKVVDFRELVDEGAARSASLTLLEAAVSAAEVMAASGPGYQVWPLARSLLLNLGRMLLRLSEAGGVLPMEEVFTQPGALSALLQIEVMQREEQRSSRPACDIHAQAALDSV